MWKHSTRSSNLATMPPGMLNGTGEGTVGALAEAAAGGAGTVRMDSAIATSAGGDWGLTALRRTLRA